MPVVGMKLVGNGSEVVGRLRRPTTIGRPGPQIGWSSHVQLQLSRHQATCKLVHDIYGIWSGGAYARAESSLTHCRGGRLGPVEHRNNDRHDSNDRGGLTGIQVQAEADQ